MQALESQVSQLQTENFDLKTKIAEHDVKFSRLEDNPRTLYAPDAKVSRKRRSAYPNSAGYGYTQGRDKYAYGTGGGGMYFRIIISKLNDTKSISILCNTNFAQIKIKKNNKYIYRCVCSVF